MYGWLIALECLLFFVFKENKGNVDVGEKGDRWSIERTEWRGSCCWDIIFERKNVKK